MRTVYRRTEGGDDAGAPLRKWHFHKYLVQNGVLKRAKAAPATQHGVIPSSRP